MIRQLHKGFVSAGFWGRYGLVRRGHAMRFLWKHQWASRDEILHFQWLRLKRMLAHAYNTVPYYRDVFKTLGATPEDILSRDDMLNLPTLTKSIIQERFDDLCSSQYDRSQLIENHTGGSTGEPLTYYQCRNYRDWAMAEKIRCYRISGWSPGQPWAFFWGSAVEGKQHEGLKRISDRAFGNYIWVNTLGLTEEQIWDHVRALQKLQPKLIVGYVSSLRMLCDFMKHHDLTGCLRPDSIQTSAEVLTPTDRALLSETFGCQVFDRYGGRECSNLAHECEAHEGLHLLCENNYVETINGNMAAKVGEAGRIVVTNLTNFGMPFIRYEQGDVGIPTDDACSCGRNYPMLESVQGRTYGNIVCPSGKIVFGHTFTMLFYEIMGVKKFQAVQTELDKVTMRLVLRSDADDERVKIEVADAIHGKIDAAFNVTFEILEDIPPLPSGKHLYIITELEPPFGDGG